MKHSPQTLAEKRETVTTHLEHEDIDSMLDLMYFAQKDRKQEEKLVDSILRTFSLEY